MRPPGRLLDLSPVFRSCRYRGAPRHARAGWNGLKGGHGAPDGAAAGVTPALDAAPGGGRSRARGRAPVPRGGVRRSELARPCTEVGMPLSSRARGRDRARGSGTRPRHASDRGAPGIRGRRRRTEPSGRRCDEGCRRPAGNHNSLHDAKYASCLGPCRPILTVGRGTGLAVGLGPARTACRSVRRRRVSCRPVAGDARTRRSPRRRCPP